MLHYSLTSLRKAAVVPSWAFSSSLSLSFSVACPQVGPLKRCISADFSLKKLPVQLGANLNNLQRLRKELDNLRTWDVKCSYISWFRSGATMLMKHFETNIYDIKRKERRRKIRQIESSMENEAHFNLYFRASSPTSSTSWLMRARNKMRPNQRVWPR